MEREGVWPGFSSWSQSPSVWLWASHSAGLICSFSSVPLSWGPRKDEMTVHVAPGTVSFQ